jgi:hypothetical protein
MLVLVLHVNLQRLGKEIIPGYDYSTFFWNGKIE